jgi:hypothetical protein
MDIKLKPCPFCGRKLFMDIDDDWLPWGSGNYIWFHQYDPSCLMSEFVVNDYETEKIDAWNRRAEDEQD